MRITETHVYFFTDNDFLSNFHYSPFTEKTINYICNEQYIMAQKALLFGDIDAFEKIINATKPYVMKKIGRSVKGFDDKIWLKHRDKILYTGLYLKFTQNDKLRKQLLETKNKILVEASPYDKIYGVGLGENDDKILDENNWKGQNLLGRILMSVRENI